MMRMNAEDSSGPRAVLSAFMCPSSLPELNTPNRALWSASRRCMKKPQMTILPGASLLFTTFCDVPF